MRLGLEVFGEVPFGLEAETALLAFEWAHIHVALDVFFQHTRFSTSYSTRDTNVASSTPPPHVGVGFVGTVSPTTDQFPFRLAQYDLGAL